MGQWLAVNWLQVAIPSIAFLATLVVGLWLRRLLFSALASWLARSGWAGGEAAASVARHHFLFWFILLGLSIGIEVSVIPGVAKTLVLLSISSLFVASVTWAVISVGDSLVNIYMPPAKTPRRAVRLISNTIRITLIIVAALIVLEIWHFPTTPLLLLLMLMAVAAFLVFREFLVEAFSALQMSVSPRFREGDFIKLASGEEGYVEEIGWNTARLRTIDGTFLTIPHSRLSRQTVVNYGKPVRKATEAFEFYSHGHLTELTGATAKNLGELVAYLKSASDPILYYHTHNFVEQHHYLVPEPANDFAVWVIDALGEDTLGEQLASVDTFSFPDLKSLRDRLVGIIEEHLAAHPGDNRDVQPGRELYFLKAISLIVKTSYRASDLREFLEALRNVSLDSLYFHMFEARLRLSRGENDFAAWLDQSLGESELSQEIERLDPYTYSLEGLRSVLIRLIERRVK